MLLAMVVFDIVAGADATWISGGGGQHTHPSMMHVVQAPQGLVRFSQATRPPPSVGDTGDFNADALVCASGEADPNDDDDDDNDEAVGPGGTSD